MVQAQLNNIIQMMQACVNWFTTLLDSVGGGNIYIAFVTIALAASFLLSRFAGALVIGSDKAGKFIARTYREGKANSHNADND